MYKIIQLIIAVLVFFVPMNAYAAPGDVWIEGDMGTSEAVVYADTGTQKLGAYQFVVTFDPSSVQVVTADGNNGVTAGIHGYVSAVNTDNTAGKIVVNGFDVVGIGPGNKIEVLKISLDSDDAASLRSVSIRVDSLTDEVGEEIGN